MMHKFSKSDAVLRRKWPPRLRSLRALGEITILRQLSPESGKLTVFSLLIIG